MGYGSLDIGPVRECLLDEVTFYTDTVSKCSEVVNFVDVWESASQVGPQGKSGSGSEDKVVRAQPQLEQSE